MTSNILIFNAKMVNEGVITEGDLLIKNGRIDKIAPSIDASGVKAVDAEGKLLIPGMIDDQVHFREPGFTHKGEIATESAAAVAGGITSYMEMPNVNPLTINLDALEDKYLRASKKSLANYSFYLGASNDNLEVIKSCPKHAACGIKVFMGASTGNMLVDDPDTLEGIFANAPLLVATHCEDSPTIERIEAEYIQRLGAEGIKPSDHPAIRSEEACYLSSSMAIELAKKHDTRLHVLHLTTAKELQQFPAGAVAGKRITGEACVHHLFFNESDYEKLGNLIKCNPAIKTKADQQAILQAINDDRIDVIATDHAPHTWDEKQNLYPKAPSGLPLVQDSLLSLFEFYHDGVFNLEKIVQKTSHSVAELFDIKNRGYLREGYWADLTLIDLNNGLLRHNNQVLSKCGWSPFAGYQFRSNIDKTWVNGQMVWSNNKINHDFRGQRLKFNR
ncbi:MAG: dihydroorotase [Gammaproteobacteria bacterium]|nr:dihydroorotase [Gammaproteobacteria bacterium]